MKNISPMAYSEFHKFDHCHRNCWSGVSHGASSHNLLALLGFHSSSACWIAWRGFGLDQDGQNQSLLGKIFITYNF